MIAASKAPVFYTGGGVINAGPRASQLLRDFQEKPGAPVTSTLMGLGAFPAGHPDWLGMLGMHGTYEANLAMNQADLIICLGARFDDRVTGRLDAFAPNSKKIHIDIDRASINKTVPVDLPIIGDCAQVLEQLLDAWGDRKPQDLAPWKARVETWREKKSLSYPLSEKAIMPQLAIAAFVRADQGSGPDHLHRSRPAPDVGSAALPFLRSQQMADFRAALAPWAMACPPRSARKSAIPMRW